MSENVYRHSGDLGDVIYSLPVLKNTGGGHLVLTQAPYVREPFTSAKVEKVATFFASQPYIASVQFNGGQVNPTYNLDDFRAVWLKLRRQGAHLQYNLAELFLFTFDLPLKLAQEKWLTIPESENSKAVGAEVIFARSFRYRNDRFPWKAVWEKYQARAVFLGSENEFHEFSGNVGKIPYIATPTLLEAAQLISACKLFVGNQSALYAVAEGCKIPRMIEIWRAEPNCLFPGAIHGFDATVELPDL